MEKAKQFWVMIIISLTPFIVTSILVAGSVISNNKKIPILESRVSDLEMIVRFEQEENGYLIRELIKKILPPDQACQIITLADQHKANMIKLIEDRKRSEAK